MSSKKNFLKYIAIVFVVMLIVSLCNLNKEIDLLNRCKASLYEGLRTIKITEEKANIDDTKLFISIKRPEIHYSNSKVERYINSYIRRDISNFVNHERQSAELYNNNSKINVCINYHVAFEDKNLLNIVIYKNKNWSKGKVELEKESYIFDLKTGQRVYLNNFLKDNEDYIQTISDYIDDYIYKNKLKVNKNKITIDRNTNYIIVQDGIDLYFNPYKTSYDKINYEFKIPYDIFKNKIRIVTTNPIVSNIDTQTITKNNSYISSIINIPIIMMENKNIEKTINNEITNSIMKFYNEAQSQAKEYQKDLPDIGNKFVANTDFKIKKNSDNMLSLVIEYYKYSGGAHGYYEDITYNIDSRDGKILSFKDLFKEESNYKNIIDKEIRNQIENIIKKDPQYDGVYEFNGVKDNTKFYIQDDNIVVYFDLYEIAPYAAGIPEFPINIKVVNHILKDEYIEFLK
ncbi:PdaC/SigV domain-containing protein [Romboutsia sp.]|uniref:PdaC/SigV domain-containing protein n=1 Tax=Romboutsia sp. TaxID=1965302 RepID=UPI003F375F84